MHDEQKKISSVRDGGHFILLIECLSGVCWKREEQGLWRAHKFSYSMTSTPTVEQIVEGVTAVLRQMTLSTRLDSVLILHMQRSWTWLSARRPPEEVGASSEYDCHASMITQQVL